MSKANQFITYLPNVKLKSYETIRKHIMCSGITILHYTTHLEFNSSLYRNVDWDYYYELFIISHILTREKNVQKMAEKENLGG